MAYKKICAICDKEFTYNYYEGEDDTVCMNCYKLRIKNTLCRVEENDTKFIKNLINFENMLS